MRLTNFPSVIFFCIGPGDMETDWSTIILHFDVLEIGWVLSKKLKKEFKKFSNIFIL